MGKCKGCAALVAGLLVVAGAGYCSEDESEEQVITPVTDNMVKKEEFKLPTVEEIKESLKKIQPKLQKAWDKTEIKEKNGEYDGIRNEFKNLENQLKVIIDEPSSLETTKMSETVQRIQGVINGSSVKLRDAEAALAGVLLDKYGDSNLDLIEKIMTCVFPEVVAEIVSE